MKRYLVAGLAVAGLFYCLPVEAQNSGAVPQYAVPIGKGAGTTGFGSAAPGATGTALVSNGPGSSPSFQSVAGASFAAQNANKVFSGPASGADAVPTFRALVGTDLPLPGTSTLGGVKSLAASANNFLTGLGADGAFTRAQPAFSNLSGSWSCAQSAALTGNVTRPAGSCATTIANLAVTNGMLAGSIAASKLIGTDIATVGTVAAGTWQGTKIGLAYGGTNADLSATGGTSQFLKQNTAGGAIVPTRPACADLSNAAASCSTDATNASNISSGTLPAARLPNPAASTLGGINSKDCSAGGQFVQVIGTNGAVTCATPSGAWTTYTPTCASNTGTITTFGAVTGQYLQIGKMVYFTARCDITTNGTGAGFIKIGLPFTAATNADFIGAGTEASVSGKTVQANILTGSPTNANVFFYDGTYPGANSAKIRITGFYEVP